ncbi:hypothetical protein CAPTEDRAFT_228355 [Capitella teleta]|uniref:Uncharacterized protein n=1 Tax=Capitella teleta TaxID=283909 RepID=R7VFY1_CAPTE|nr:hypothetical protein CAPTEDRAFT_228355 [Capitella teleta]|eukprot:ELU17482.1 hypothetical protein CAPTEDRAFT_228355 [Capitella teleta]
MANSRASWEDVSRKVVHVSQSPRAVETAGETLYSTTTTSSSRSASPSRVTREVVNVSQSPRAVETAGERVYSTTTTSSRRSASPSRGRREVIFDDDAEAEEVLRSSVVSPSNVDMEPMRSSRSVVKNTVVSSHRSRSKSPVRNIIKEIHHYEDAAGEEIQVVKTNAGSATKKVTKVEKVVAAAPASALATTRVSEVHQYANAAAKPAASKVVVKEVRTTAPVRKPVAVREVIKEIHHYDQTPRATNNVQTTVTESRVVAPAAQVAKEVHRESRVARDNGHYNQTTKVVQKVSNRGNLKNSNINTSSNIHTTVVNEKANLNRGSSIKTVNTQSVYRDASPSRDSGCCGKRSKASSSSSHYNSSHVNNHSTNRVDDHLSNSRHGTQYNSVYSNTEAGRRRGCCVACLGLLGLLLLGGLIAGLYFGIKAALDKQESSKAINQYNQGYGNSGYYVNGVYVIPITLYDSRVYLIYGNDVPCNKYNNNTDSTDVIQNCEDLTTSISIADWTTTVGPVVNVNPIVANNPGCRPQVALQLIGAAVLCSLHAYYFQLHT